MNDATPSLPIKLTAGANYIRPPDAAGDLDDRGSPLHHQKPQRLRLEPRARAEAWLFGTKLTYVVGTFQLPHHVRLLPSR